MNPLSSSAPGHEADAWLPDAIRGGEAGPHPTPGRSSLVPFEAWTQQPDRRHFRDRLHLSLEPAPAHPRRGLLIVKLDGLNAMFDAYGSNVGDAVRRIAGARLQHALRAGDVVRCLDTDEIACLVAMSTDESLANLAQALFDLVAAPIVVDPFEHQLFPSIGIATSPANGTTADALLKRANTAMKRAQRERMAYAFFDATGGNMRADTGAGSDGVGGGLHGSAA